MPTDMLRGLGYDDQGNAPELLAPRDAAALERGDWRRTDGRVRCLCGSLYYVHPVVQGALWLRRTCDVGLVKL